MTSLIRSAFLKELRKRLRRIREAIRDLFFKRNFLGDQELGLLRVPRKQRVVVLQSAVWNYVFEESEDELSQFESYLRTVFDKELFEGNWIDRYIERAYADTLERKSRHLDQMLARHRELAKHLPSPDIAVNLLAPQRPEKVARLARRSYESLKGFEGDAVNRLKLILLDGLAHGERSTEIVPRMLEEFDFLTERRAEVIARTEIIRAHAEGALDLYSSYSESLKVRVIVEFSATEDNRVCPKCASLEGLTFTLQDARDLIPVHPNCRCTFIPDEDSLIEDLEREMEEEAEEYPAPTEQVVEKPKEVRRRRASTRRPARRPVEKPAEEVVEKPKKASKKKAAKKVAKKPAEEVVEKPVEKPAGKPAEEAVEKPKKVSKKKTVKKPAEEAVEKPAEKPVEKPLEEVVKEPEKGGAPQRFSYRIVAPFIKEDPEVASSEWDPTLLTDEILLNPKEVIRKARFLEENRDYARRLTRGHMRRASKRGATLPVLSWISSSTCFTAIHLEERYGEKIPSHIADMIGPKERRQAKQFKEFIEEAASQSKPKKVLHLFRGLAFIEEREKRAGKRFVELMRKAERGEVVLVNDIPNSSSANPTVAERFARCLASSGISVMMCIKSKYGVGVSGRYPEEEIVLPPGSVLEIEKVVEVPKTDVVDRYIVYARLYEARPGGVEGGKLVGRFRAVKPQK